MILKLNELLFHELAAANKYLLYAAVCKDWGFDRLADVFNEECGDEREHAKELVEQIISLGGIPAFAAHQIVPPITINEMLNTSLIDEKCMSALLNLAIDEAIKTNDHVTRMILEDILKAEDESADFFESQLDAISRTGINNYLTQQLHSAK